MPAKRHKSPPTQDATVTAAELLSRLINEVARLRARNRALIEALVDSGSVARSDYINKYKDVEAADMRAFVDMLVLSKAEFERRHSDWLEENRAKFGFAREAGVEGVALQETSSKTKRLSEGGARARPRS